MSKMMNSPRGRINVRLVLTVTVFSILVGMPVYSFVRAQINHGIEKDGDHFNVDLKTLGNFKFSDGTSEPAGTINDVPPQFRSLDGQRIALEGLVFAPQNAGGNVNRFQFVYNINKCCLGGPPQVQERVFASYPGAGFDPPSQSDFVRIVGKLHVNVQKDEVGVIRKLYTMDVERLERL